MLVFRLNCAFTFPDCQSRFLQSGKWFQFTLRSKSRKNKKKIFFDDNASLRTCKTSTTVLWHFPISDMAMNGLVLDLILLLLLLFLPSASRGDQCPEGAQGRGDDELEAYCKRTLPSVHLSHTDPTSLGNQHTSTANKLRYRPKCTLT